MVGRRSLWVEGTVGEEGRTAISTIYILLLVEYGQIYAQGRIDQESMARGGRGKHQMKFLILRRARAVACRPLHRTGRLDWTRSHLR